LFFPFRPIAVVNYKGVSKLLGAMTDWTKYPEIRIRVSPTLKADVLTAADKSGLSEADWTRWALLSASTDPTNDDEKRRVSNAA